MSFLDDPRDDRSSGSVPVAKSKAAGELRDSKGRLVAVPEKRKGYGNTGVHRSGDYAVAGRTSPRLVAKSRDARPWLLLIAAVVVALDRWSKIFVAKHVAMGSAITVIPRVFRITHVLNTGAAFSMFQDSTSPMAVRVALIIFSSLVGALVLGLLAKYGRLWSLASVGFAMVLGGAIGNLYDRAVLHYVTDFLEVNVFGYHWPDFNVADSAISIGAVLLLVEMILPRGNDEAADEAGDVRGA